MRVEIHGIDVKLDPPLTVYNVVLDAGSATWHQTCASESELRAFVQGLRAACMLSPGEVYLPPLAELPRPGQTVTITGGVRLVPGRKAFGTIETTEGGP